MRRGEGIRQEYGIQLEGMRRGEGIGQGLWDTAGRDEERGRDHAGLWDKAGRDEDRRRYQSDGIRLEGMRIG